MLKKLTMLTAAASLAMGGVAASQAQAAVAPPRAGAEMGGASELRGRSETFVQLSVLAVIALLIWAGTELFDDDEGDSESP